MMVVLLGISVVVIAAGMRCVIIGSGRAGVSGAPACFECGYALAGHPDDLARCPECGRAVARGGRAPRWRLMLFGLVLVICGTLWVIRLLAADHWSSALPRPVVALALRVTVPPPLPGPSHVLPTPHDAWKDSDDRWERLKWQMQVARAFDAFHEQVVAAGTSGAALETLVPAAFEVREHIAQFGGTRSDDAFVARGTLRSLRKRRGELDARYGRSLGTWMASELQFRTGSSPHRPPDWVAPPVQAIVALATSSDPDVRLYAIDRLVRIDAPAVEGMITRLRDDDPDPAVRQRATDAAGWRDAFRSALIPVNTTRPTEGLP